MRTVLVFGLIIAALASPSAWADPCSVGIHSAQIQFDTRLKAAAAKGPAGAQSTEAKLHRQPSLKSVAKAEADLGDISADDARAFGVDMQRARAADTAGDPVMCEAALKDARSILAH